MRHLVMSAVLLSLVAVAHAEPPPGHPSPGQAMQLMGQPAQAQANTALEGTVAEAFNSNSYTYVRVTMTGGGERWMAIPQTELAVGDRIRFEEGTRMENFYSKVWQRTFPEIYFLGGVEKVAAGQ